MAEGGGAGRRNGIAIKSAIGFSTMALFIFGTTAQFEILPHLNALLLLTIFHFYTIINNIIYYSVKGGPHTDEYDSC